MASPRAGMLNKVNTLVHADLSSPDSDDASDRDGSGGNTGSNQKTNQRKHDGKNNPPLSYQNMIQNTSNRDNMILNKQNTVAPGEREGMGKEQPTSIQQNKTGGKLHSNNSQNNGFMQSTDLHKVAENYQGYFVSQLPNGYYTSSLRENDYSYCNYADLDGNVPRVAPLWSTNFENTAIVHENPIEPKYFNDFIINNPALNEISIFNAIDNLPSAHQVANDNELSRYYSVLELPRPSQNRSAIFKPEGEKDRFSFGKPGLGHPHDPYGQRNKRQTFKTPTMETLYDNANCPLRFERGLSIGFQNIDSPRFENPNRRPIQVNNVTLPHEIKTFPDQFQAHERNRLINPSPQGLKGPYSVYTPGNVNSPSLQNVYNTTEPIYSPIPASRHIYSPNNNNQGRNLKTPNNHSNMQGFETQYSGIRSTVTNENVHVPKNPYTEWNKNGPVNNQVPKFPYEEKANNLPPQVVYSPKKNWNNGPVSPNSQIRQGPYEGNDLSLQNPEKSNYPLAKSNRYENNQEKSSFYENLEIHNNSNTSYGGSDPIERILDALKLTYRNRQRGSRQNAEVQKNDPFEVVKKDKTTHTKGPFEDKETQYKPLCAIESSEKLKEIGTQVRCIKPHTKKSQGVATVETVSAGFKRSGYNLNQNEKKARKNDFLNDKSRYYIGLDESQDKIYSERKNRGYREIADIIKREYGNDNQEMTDVIFNMIYGKNCQIVVQKGFPVEDGKRASTSRDFRGSTKKNQGMSTSSTHISGFLTPTNQSLDARWKTDYKNTASLTKGNNIIIASPILNTFDKVSEGKNSINFIKKEETYEKDNLKTKYNFVDSAKPCSEIELNYYIKNNSEARKRAEINDSFGLLCDKNNANSSESNKTVKQKDKIKLDPIMLKIEKGNDCIDKGEILLDLDNEKILQCILKDGNIPKGEIIIDVGGSDSVDGSEQSNKLQDKKDKEDSLKSEESRNLTRILSPTELYEEAILNLITKQIKKCSSDWNLDEKESEDYREISPITVVRKQPTKTKPSLELHGRHVKRPNSSKFRRNDSIDEIVGHVHIEPQEMKGKCIQNISSDAKKITISKEDQEFDDVYDNIKYLFGKLEDNEKYEFFNEAMKKISELYSEELKSPICEPPKAQITADSNCKKAKSKDEESVIAQILRMICYEYDIGNLETVAAPETAPNVLKEANDSNKSHKDLLTQRGQEIMSNYVFLETPNQIYDLGSHIISKLMDRYQLMADAKTVSRGVTANL